MGDESAVNHVFPIICRMCRGVAEKHCEFAAPTEACHADPSICGSTKAGKEGTNTRHDYADTIGIEKRTEVVNCAQAGRSKQCQPEKLAVWSKSPYSLLVKPAFESTIVLMLRKRLCLRIFPNLILRRQPTTSRIFLPFRILNIGP